MPITRCGSECRRDPYKSCTDPRTEYEGCVLYTYERNGYHDSDFVAVVWDDETNNFKHVEYATTRFPTYHNHATEDATDEVKTKAADRHAESSYKLAVIFAQEESKKPLPGRGVKSLTTRGKNKGKVGTVVTREVDPYKSDRWGTEYRVKVQVWGEVADDGSHLFYPAGDERLRLAYWQESNTEVLNPAPIDYEELEHVREAARRNPHFHDFT